MANAKRVLKAPSQTPMVVPSHGRGLIRVGGTNKGGTGRPKDVVRQACLHAFDERVKVLKAIADDKNAAEVDRMRAIDVLGKYGMGPAQEVKHVGSDSGPLVVVHEHVQVQPGRIRGTATVVPNEEGSDE